MRKNDIKNILKLTSGENYIIPESDCGINVGYTDGIAEVWRLNNVFVLFSIPVFGGNPVHEKTYHIQKVNEMFDYIDKWN